MLFSPNMWFMYLVAAYLFCNVAVSSAKSFNCENKAIPDAWRKVVLDFHNEHRRRLARGEQESRDGKLMPAAKDMHELDWDCHFEEDAHSNLCLPDSVPTSRPGVISETINLDGSASEIRDETVSILEKWWDEVKNADLSFEPTLDKVQMKDFGHMAYAITTDMACTYGYCDGKGKLRCEYSSRPGTGEPLYEKAATYIEACSACNSPCVDHLCSHRNSQPAVFGCKNTAIPDKWRKLVLEFHNEHRRKLAEGRQTTNGGNSLMPAAKDMSELNWDCNIEEKVRLEVCNGVPMLPPDYARLSETLDLEGNTSEIRASTEKVLEKWWNEVESADLSMSSKFADFGAENFGTMAYAKTDGFACSYGYCTGVEKLLCVYNRRPMHHDLLYMEAHRAEETCNDCPHEWRCVNHLCRNEKYMPDEKLSHF
ncbi:hypothetical protein Y032_0017g3263 [Ancylostoma ceylanicum]|nr:hypothetical protein Y032_0017g3263 [Ancylostoma ceylanicum]